MVKIGVALAAEFYLWIKPMFDRLTWFFTRCLMGGLAIGVMSFAAMAEGRKLALVVGNEAYEALPGLTTPAADAQAMSKALRDLGFEVTLLTDVGPEVFQAVLGSFADQSKTAETVLFYYSGHAFQKDGVNHLVPVNARLVDGADLQRQTWRLDDIAAQLKSGPGQLLLFLDACRDNPLPEAVRGRAGPGLAQFDGGAGTFVAFATAPGALAWDTQAGAANSPFTTALLDHIATPGQTISDLMIAVRNEVDAATGGKQTPWEQSSLRSQFFFAPGVAPDLALDLPKFELAEVSVEIGPADGGDAVAEAAAAVAHIAGVPVRLAALNATTRSLAAVGGVQSGALRLKGSDGGAEVVAIPADLPLAVQGELLRIGCYAMAVDGDWGNGSRKAMAQYYAAKKLDPGEVEPTEAVYRALVKEPEKTCKTPAAVTKKAPVKAASKAPVKKSTPKKSTPTTTTKKAAPPAPKKDGIKCKFMIVAVVCS